MSLVCVSFMDGDQVIGKIIRIIIINWNGNGKSYGGGFWKSLWILSPTRKKHFLDKKNTRNISWNKLSLINQYRKKKSYYLLHMASQKYLIWHSTMNRLSIFLNFYKHGHAYDRKKSPLSIFGILSIFI